MSKFRFLTAGESHGRALSAIIEGTPAGVDLIENDIEEQLKRRQRGYGRGGRMQIEKDRAQILSGVRYGKTLGSPISLLIENKDWPNWIEKMTAAPVENPAAPLQMPRPGHADFSGMVKYRHNDLRNILERSSARETAMRVATGAIARKILAQFGIRIYGHVVQIGAITSSFSAMQTLSGRNGKEKAALLEWEDLMQKAENSPMACADEQASQKMMALVDETKERGDTLGGLFEIVATGLPVGLGSHVHWDKRLDGLVAWAMMSINAMKCVELGIGHKVAEIPGSQVHDQLYYEKDLGYFRSSNSAGGIEGGMTNGEPLVVRVSMKPLPTLSSPLQSVDTGTQLPMQAFHERSDVCAVPAGVVVGEAMLAIVLVNALMDKIGGDSIAEMKNNYAGLPCAPLEW